MTLTVERDPTVRTLLRTSARRSCVFICVFSRTKVFRRQKAKNISIFGRISTFLKFDFCFFKICVENFPKLKKSLPKKIRSGTKIKHWNHVALISRQVYLSTHRIAWEDCSEHRLRLVVVSWRGFPIPSFLQDKSWKSGIVKSNQAK